jgi:hypothetical protein
LALAMGLRYAVSFDEAHYLRLAAMAQSQGLAGVLHPYWSPFLPAAIAAVAAFIPDLETAGRMVSVLSGTVVVWIVFRMASELYDRREALLSAAFVALFPPAAFGSTAVMPEPLLSLAALLGLMLGWRAVALGNPVLALPAGAAWGAAYLLKPEGIGFLIVYLGALAVPWFFKIRGTRRPVLAWTACAAAAGFVVLTAPYLIYLRQATGGWTLSTKGTVNQQLEAAVYFKNKDNPDPFFHLTADDRVLPYDNAWHFGTLRELSGSQEGRTRVVAIPFANVAKKYVKNFYHVAKVNLPQTFGMVPAVLLVAGLAGTRFRQRRNLGFALLCAAAILFFWFLVVPLFHVNERYFLPLLPVCFVPVGRGAVSMSEWLRVTVRIMGGRGRGTAARTPAFLVAAFVLVFGLLPEAARLGAVRKSDPSMWADPVELKEAGRWLAEHAGPAPVIADVNKAVDFYAGQMDIRKGASFSYDPVERNLAYARSRNASYFVFSSRYSAWFPNMNPLLDGKGIPAGLSLVYASDDPPGIRTVIYRIDPRDSSQTAGSGR